MSVIAGFHDKGKHKKQYNKFFHSFVLRYANINNNLDYFFDSNDPK
jgi:hypothetical protein